MRIELSDECDPEHYVRAIRRFNVRIEGVDYSIREVLSDGLVVARIDESGSIIGDLDDAEFRSYMNIEEIYVY